MGLGLELEDGEYLCAFKVRGGAKIGRHVLEVWVCVGMNSLDTGVPTR